MKWKSAMCDDNSMNWTCSRFPIVEGAEPIETIEDLLRRHGFFDSAAPNSAAQSSEETKLSLVENHRRVESAIEPSRPQDSKSRKLRRASSTEGLSSYTSMTRPRSL